MKNATPATTEAPQATAQRYLPESEVATITGLSTLTLRSWRARGCGPKYCKLGTAVRYRLEDIEKWIEESTAAAGK